MLFPGLLICCLALCLVNGMRPFSRLLGGKKKEPPKPYCPEHSCQTIFKHNIYFLADKMQASLTECERSLHAPHKGPAEPKCEAQEFTVQEWDSDGIAKTKELQQRHKEASNKKGKQHTTENTVQQEAKKQPAESSSGQQQQFFYEFKWKGHVPPGKKGKFKDYVWEVFTHQTVKIYIHSTGNCEVVTHERHLGHVKPIGLFLCPERACEEDTVFFLKNDFRKKPVLHLLRVSKVGKQKEGEEAPMAQFWAHLSKCKSGVSKIVPQEETAAAAEASEARATAISEDSPATSEDLPEDVKYEGGVMEHSGNIAVEPR